MRFEDVRIYGHQRSGNHYLAALVNENFIHRPSYVELFDDGHRPHTPMTTINPISRPDRLHLYIKRDFPHVAHSVWVMRGRFGLEAGNFRSFLRRHYLDMFADGRDCPAQTIYDYMDEPKVTTGVSSFFESIDATPYDWWKFHLKAAYAYTRRGTPNVMVVSYNRLLADFDHVMAMIALRLGVDIRHGPLKNIGKQVGWRAA